MTLRVPLSSLRDGELFAVHVSMDAEAIDARGRESAVEAFIRDPQSVEPALVKTTGLKARGKPRFREPRVKALGAASCPAGPRSTAGRLQLGAPAYVTDESTGVPMFVLVTRTGGTKGSGQRHRQHARGIGNGGRRLQDDEHHRQVLRRGRLAAARRGPDPRGSGGRGRADVQHLAVPRPLREARRAAQRRGDDRRRRRAARADSAQLHDRRHGRRAPRLGPGAPRPRLGPGRRRRTGRSRCPARAPTASPTT